MDGIPTFESAKVLRTLKRNKWTNYYEAITDTVNVMNFRLRKKKATASYECHKRNAGMNIKNIVKQN